MHFLIELMLGRFLNVVGVFFAALILLFDFLLDQFLGLSSRALTQIQELVDHRLDPVDPSVLHQEKHSSHE